MADKKGYSDFQDHLKTLDERGLLRKIDEPINKDTEMHPLVRWQFRGGIQEPNRKAFLFNNITCSRGKSYQLPVAVGALSSNKEIYSIGIGAPIEDIGKVWSRAIANPIKPIEVTSAPCQDVVIEGSELEGEARGWIGCLSQYPRLGLIVRLTLLPRGVSARILILAYKIWGLIVLV